MSLSRLSASIACVVLLFSLANPPRANALSDEEIAYLVVGGLAAFVGLVIVGTLLTRDEAKMFLMEPVPSRDERESGVSSGLACRTPDGQPALVCW